MDENTKNDPLKVSWVESCPATKVLDLEDRLVQCKKKGDHSRHVWWPNREDAKDRVGTIRAEWYEKA